MSETNLLSSTTHINRKIRAKYPHWIDHALHPELDITGPTDPDFSLLDRYVHDRDLKIPVKGGVIYQKVKDNDILASCLNLQDGAAIIAMGREAFHKNFPGCKKLYLWKSVGQERSIDRLIFVPYVLDEETNADLVIRWAWTGAYFDTDNTVYRHPPKKVEEVKETKAVEEVKVVIEATEATSQTP